MMPEKAANVSSSEASSFTAHNRGKRKRAVMETAASNDTNDAVNLARLAEAANKSGFSIDLDGPLREKLNVVKGERMNAWTALLLSRPQDSNDEAMANWLMKVMAVSDLTRSMEQVIASWKEGTANPDANGGQKTVASGAVGVGSSGLSSTEHGDSNDSSSINESSNESTEETSSENQDGNSDEQDRASSTPTENDTSDDENQDDGKGTSSNETDAFKSES